MLSLGRRLKVPRQAPVAAKGCHPKFPRVLPRKWVFSEAD
jgi:hypothetical protein